MFCRSLTLAAALIVSGGWVAAQDSDATRQERERDTRTRAEETTQRDRQPTTAEGEQDPATRREGVSERVRRASRLPRTTSQAREAGVPEERVRETIRVARERGIPADETQQILEVETEEVLRGGNPENFGAFVQQAKESGLRGRDLAEAIHDEQVARGMKKPGKDPDSDRGHSKGKGRGGRADRDDDDRDDEDRGKGKGRDKNPGKKGGK